MVNENRVYQIYNAVYSRHKEHYIFIHTLYKEKHAANIFRKQKDSAHEESSRAVQLKQGIRIFGRGVTN